jgi:Protein of unknown function DUF262/Protein of unknown function (DUF1524)
MKANAASLLMIFEKKMRLEVPLFQRQYVWTQDHQWEPLWEDIALKFTEYLEGRKDAPIHFLSAMVLDQKETPTTHVERRQIIDGQQRLTTLQIFLAAFRDFCAEQQCGDLANECTSFTMNRGMMADPDADRFKVWPTHGDRAQFKDVISAASAKELELRYPLKRRPYARKPEPRPRMIEAYLFFRERLTEFFLGAGGEPPVATSIPLGERLDECLQALKNSLHVVVIDLEDGDDAQVIFETLNARGEPLLPADLLRNFIFLRAARQHEPQEALYEEYWRQFDDPFWRQEIRQGRLSRPRSDLFMQHFLASRQLVEIPIRHLFVEYKFWIQKKRPFATVRDELALIARNGAFFRRLVEPRPSDVLFDLLELLEAFDVRTTYPLLLVMAEADPDEHTWRQASLLLQSYLLRRAVCGLSTKSYTRVFLGIARSVRDEISPDRLARELGQLSGEASEWPSDEAFAEAWRTRHAYQTLGNAKVVYILKRLNETFRSAKMERLTVTSPLSVDHILPQQWLQHWPLPDGSRGLSLDELHQRHEADPAAIATRRRNAGVQTIGNLTIVTQPLNSAASNSAWDVKKRELMKSSLLPLNQQLFDIPVWDEFAIEARSAELLERALQLWPRHMFESATT